MEKAERFKLLSETFLRNDIRVFIQNLKDDYYFCDIILVTEDYVYVKSFKGKRDGEKEKIYFFEILKLEEYKGG